MTLIIGVVCRDGIVIGADSIETSGDIEQEVNDKIQSLADDALIACAGAVGMIQVLNHELRKSWEDIVSEEDVFAARSLITQLMWSEIRPALAHAREAQELLGEALVGSVLSSSLIALVFQGNPLLLSFNAIGQCAEVTAESPFVSIGSGGFQSDPFLAFVRRIVWGGRYPKSIDDGVLGVLWALQHVIRVNAGLGVGGRPVVATLQNIDGAWETVIMKGPLLDQNLQRIGGAEKAVRMYLDELSCK